MTLFFLVLLSHLLSPLILSPLLQLGLSDGACMVVGHNTPTLVAFDHMTVDGKSSVAIVDDKGR